MHTKYLTAFLLLAPALTAQSSLAELEQRFERERQEMVRSKGGAPTLADFRALADRHTAALAEFLESAGGVDAVNGRLMLTDIHLQIGQRDQAISVLKQLDPGTAPGMELLAAAELAQMLGLEPQRDRWISVAMSKSAPFEERMAMGMMLMTRLVEIEQGEKVFDDAIAAATNDEERAKVLWYRADATREREDLEDGAYEEALGELAKKHPKTYFGSVAADRLVAMRFEEGKPAIRLTGKDLSGESIDLDRYRGKVVLLDFWIPGHPAVPGVASRLKQLQNKYGARGFDILGVPLAEDKAAVDAAVKANGVAWRQLFDGRGMLTDAALRYNVESIPYFVLIDKQGKIAHLGLFLEEASGLPAAEQAIEAALK